MCELLPARFLMYDDGDSPSTRQSFRSSSLSSVRQGGRLAGLEKQRDMAHFRMLVTYRNILTCGKLNSWRCSFFFLSTVKKKPVSWGGGKKHQRPQPVGQVQTSHRQICLLERLCDVPIDEEVVAALHCQCGMWHGSTFRELFFAKQMVSFIC